MKFDLKKFDETLLTKDNLDDALWTIAEECREWRKMSYFTNWRSFRHGAMQLTKLEKNYIEIRDSLECIKLKAKRNQISKWID